MYNKKEYDKKYRLNNKEKIKELAKKYNREHGDRKKQYNLKHKEERKKQRQEYRFKNKEKLRKEKKKYRLEKKYKLTVAQYEHMLITQNNKCSICNSDMDGYRNCCVDHNHKTNKVRELLCHNCNKMLGFARDNAVTLLKAVNYLNKWN